MMGFDTASDSGTFSVKKVMYRENEVKPCSSLHRRNSMKKILTAFIIIAGLSSAAYPAKITLDVDTSSGSFTTNVMIDGVSYEVKMTKKTAETPEEKLEMEMESAVGGKTATETTDTDSDMMMPALSNMEMDGRYLIMVPMQDRVHYAYYIRKIANDDATAEEALEMNDDQSVASNQFFVIPLELDDMDGEKVYPYLIEKGDTLSHIAYYFWEKAYEWEKLLDYNEVPIHTPKEGEPYRLIITDKTLIVPMYDEYILNMPDESKKSAGTAQVSVDIEVESSAGIEATAEVTEVTVKTNG